jgi:hypothetical protein
MYKRGGAAIPQWKLYEYFCRLVKFVADPKRMRMVADALTQDRELWKPSYLVIGVLYAAETWLAGQSERWLSCALFGGAVACPGGLPINPCHPQKSTNRRPIT